MAPEDGSRGCSWSSGSWGRGAGDEHALENVSGTETPGEQRPLLQGVMFLHFGSSHEFYFSLAMEHVTRTAEHVLRAIECDSAFNVL